MDCRYEALAAFKKLYNRRFPIKYSAATVKGTADANLSTHCREIVALQSASYAQV